MDVDNEEEWIKALQTTQTWLFTHPIADCSLELAKEESMALLTFRATTADHVSNKHCQDVFEIPSSPARPSKAPAGKPKKPQPPTVVQRQHPAAQLKPAIAPKMALPPPADPNARVPFLKQTTSLPQQVKTRQPKGNTAKPVSGKPTTKR
jgi:hypothetical protein